MSWLPSLLLFIFKRDDIEPQRRNNDRYEINDVVQPRLPADEILIMLIEIKRTDNPDGNFVREVLSGSNQKVEVEAGKAPQNENGNDIGDDSIAVEGGNGASQRRKRADNQNADQIGGKDVEIVERG